jgi:chemotaxis protein MotB
MKRKQAEERPDWETSNVGLMMFTSLMVILLAFFILLTSMAVIDEQRKVEALGSVLGAFGLLPGGLSPTPDSSTHVAPSTSPIDVVQNDIDLMKEVLSNRLIENKVHFLRGRTRRIISLESAILFPPDGVDIVPAMRPSLLEIAKILQNTPYIITIEGHTDDQPPQTEAYQDNWEISALRALNVMRFLAVEGGLDSVNMSAYGYAGFKPVVSNTSPRNRARNNRMDLVLDYSKMASIEEYKNRYKRIKFFDFKGFQFRLGGGEG